MRFSHATRGENEKRVCVMADFLGKYQESTMGDLGAPDGVVKCDSFPLRAEDTWKNLKDTFLRVLHEYVFRGVRFTKNINANLEWRRSAPQICCFLHKFTLLKQRIYIRGDRITRTK